MFFLNIQCDLFLVIVISIIPFHLRNTGSKPVFLRCVTSPSVCCGVRLQHTLNGNIKRERERESSQQEQLIWAERFWAAQVEKREAQLVTAAVSSVRALSGPRLIKAANDHFNRMRIGLLYWLVASTNTIKASLIHRSAHRQSSDDLMSNKTICYETQINHVSLWGRVEHLQNSLVRSTYSRCR